MLRTNSAARHAADGVNPLNGKTRRVFTRRAPVADGASVVDVEQVAHVVARDQLADHGTGQAGDRADDGEDVAGVDVALDGAVRVVARHHVGQPAREHRHADRVGDTAAPVLARERDEEGQRGRKQDGEGRADAHVGGRVVRQPRRRQCHGDDRRHDAQDDRQRHPDGHHDVVAQEVEGGSAKGLDLTRVCRLPATGRVGVGAKVRQLERGDHDVLLNQGGVQRGLIKHYTTKSIFVNKYLLLANSVLYFPNIFLGYKDIARINHKNSDNAEAQNTHYQQRNT